MGRSLITQEDLQDLLHKYELLLSLSDGAKGRTRERREAMRRIAVRYPGALREWDAIPREELDRRRSVVSQALTGAAPAEPWMGYALDLHACLRDVLSIRAWLVGHAAAVNSRSRLADEGLLAACAERFAQPVERIRLIAAPPGGRLAALAYADVARRHGVTVQHVKAALFLC